MRLYERHGFQMVGIYHEQGMLDGRWVDVMIIEKLLPSVTPRMNSEACTLNSTSIP
jgi:L-amino acid N-acyltransferase YncA